MARNEANKLTAAAEYKSQLVARLACFIASHLKTKMRTAISRYSHKYLLTAEAKTKEAWQIYRGKLAIVQTYTDLGKEAPDELVREVRRRESYLRHRGELT